MITYVVAVTGGIASGKSTVTDALRGSGVPIFDADLVARDLVRPTEPAFLEVVQLFGPSILQEDGQLNRRKLRELVFASPEAKAKLEAILHPRVREKLLDLVTTTNLPLVALAIPLLVESGHYDWVDCTIVVDVPRVKQIERLMRRDNLTLDLAQNMIQAQASRVARMARADVLLRNDSDIANLLSQTKPLLMHLKSLAAAKQDSSRIVV